VSGQLVLPRGVPGSLNGDVAKPLHCDLDGYSKLCGHGGDGESSQLLPTGTSGGIRRCVRRAISFVVLVFCMAVLFLLIRIGPLGHGIPEMGPSASSLIPCETNIILVRHCDKVPPWDPDPTPFEACSVKGEMRGEHLAHIFGPGGSFPQPTQLFARRMGAGIYASRDMYLLWPLAQRLGLWINASFEQTNIAGFAAALLDSREAMCSSVASSSPVAPTALVSWNHCFLPSLAQALGCQDEFCTSCWDDNNYDSVVTLNYKRNTSGEWNMNFALAREGFTKSYPAGTPFVYKECTIKTSPDNGADLVNRCSPPDSGGPPPVTVAPISAEAPAPVELI